MVTRAGEFCIGRWLLVSFGMGGALLLSGCSARVEVGDRCEGLERIGYKAPVSSQELEDIIALGFPNCARYLESTDQVDRS